MTELRFGIIDKIGDPNDDKQKGRYVVRLPEETDFENNPLVTNWIHAGRRFAQDNHDDYTYDIGESVALLLKDDYRTGYILGAIATKANPPKVTDPDIEQKTFKDGSYVKYDRKNHLYEISITGSGNKVNITADDGEVNVTAKNATIKASDEVKIDAKLHVTKDVTMDGKLAVTGDVSSNADVKAGSISLTNHTHVYIDSKGAAATPVTSNTNPPS